MLRGIVHVFLLQRENWTELLTNSVWYKSCRASVRGCLQIFVVAYNESRFFYSDPWIFKKLGESAPDPVENSQD